MYCNKCGRKLDEGVKFCDKCGEPVNVTSPAHVNAESADKKKKRRILESVISFVLFAIVVVGGTKLVEKLTGDDGSTEVGQGDKLSLVDVADNLEKYTSATDTDAANSKRSSAAEPDTTAYDEYDEDDYIYPTELIGLTVNEMIDLIGEPEMIERNFLGGGGHDTAYIYGNYTNIFIASYPPESNYNFDDRDAIINVAIVLGGDVNEYVYVDMPYSVLSETYSLSEPVLFNGGDAMLDGKYVSTSNITCNGLKCNMLAASYENGSNAPMELFMITANDLRN